MILNADLGEGESADRTRELLALVGAANVACGGHAGTDETMRDALALADNFGVRVGAHPGLPGEFGRGDVDVNCAELEALVIEQVDNLLRVGAELHHVKLHGSLYHAVEADPGLARSFGEVVRRRYPGVRIFALAGGMVERVVEGVDVWGELFAERGYAADGSLVARGEVGALIQDVALITNRVADWKKTGWLGARTICVHADSPGAVRIARAVADTLGGCR